MSENNGSLDQEQILAKIDELLDNQKNLAEKRDLVRVNDRLDSIENNLKNFDDRMSYIESKISFLSLRGTMADMPEPIRRRAGGYSVSESIGSYRRERPYRR